MNPYTRPGLSEDQVIDIWSRHYGLTIAQVIPKDRHNKVKIPRQVLMYCLRTFTGLSFGKIAERFDREHCTVLYSCRKVRETYIFDSELKLTIKALLDDLHEVAKLARNDTLMVEISRQDIWKLLDLTEEEKQEPMINLWHRYKNR